MERLLRCIWMKWFAVWFSGKTGDGIVHESENIIREYENLHNEVKQKIELHNSLIMFMITTVVAVLAFALESNASVMYLLPFAIIIPISMRITYYREAVVKLSAYIIVYIEDKMEGLNWETRNAQLINIERNNLYDSLTISHYYEGIILSIICYILYLGKYIRDETIYVQTIIYLIAPFLLVIWEIVITRRIIIVNNQKNEWIKKWKDIENAS